MGIRADIADDWHAALAALAWQVDLGVDDVTGEEPLNRYELGEPVRPAPIAAVPKPVAPPASAPSEDCVAAAQSLAERATSIAALLQALNSFEQCELKRGARNTVFADGNPAARVMILGEPPTIDEDRGGRPFVGPAGVLLDRMFAAIGLARDAEDPGLGLYLATVVPWKPPGNRDPQADEIAMLLPFVQRHVALANPDVIVVMGNTPLVALTGQRGIQRARGTWGTAFGKPMLAMAHPDYLLKYPATKREAWADLLALRAKLQGAGQP